MLPLIFFFSFETSRPFHERVVFCVSVLFTSERRPQAMSLMFSFCIHLILQSRLRAEVAAGRSAT